MKQKYRWPLLGGALLIIVLVVVVLGLLSSKSTPLKRGATPVPIEVAVARRATVPVYLRALGTVVPYRTVTVEPMITGPLLHVYFHEGQNIRQGQLLAEIDPKPFAAALRQAQAKLAQDEATLESDALTAQQDALLVKKGFVSRQTYIAARSAWLAAKAQIKQDQASIETAQINLGYTRIAAPVSGRTGILQVDPGNIVTPNLPNGIVTINTLQPIYIQFSLPQKDLNAINRAMSTGDVPLLATRKGAGIKAAEIDRGVLTVLDNQINASTGTLTLRGRFPNPNLDLWPGAYANVRVQIRTLKNVVVVPSVAVQEGPAGSFVYLVTGDARAPHGPKVAMHPVTVRYESGSLAVIGSGLAPGSTVVTEGGSQIRAHVPVKIVGHTSFTP